MDDSGSPDDPRDYATMCDLSAPPGKTWQRTLAYDDKVGALVLYPGGGQLRSSIRENEQIANYSHSDNESFWRTVSSVPTSGAQLSIGTSIRIREYNFRTFSESDWKDYPIAGPYISPPGQEFLSGQTLEIATFLCKRCVYGVDQVGYRVRRISGGQSDTLFYRLDVTSGIAVTETEIVGFY
jgi:hypothetical protein